MKTEAETQKKKLRKEEKSQQKVCNKERGTGSWPITGETPRQMTWKQKRNESDNVILSKGSLDLHSYKNEDKSLS